MKNITYISEVHQILCWGVNQSIILQLPQCTLGFVVSMGGHVKRLRANSDIYEILICGLDTIVLGQIWPTGLEFDIVKVLYWKNFVTN